MSSSRVIKSDHYEKLREFHTIKTGQLSKTITTSDVKEDNETVSQVNEEDLILAKKLVEDAKAEAEQILSLANEQSRQLVIEAEQNRTRINAELEEECNRLYEEAKQSGYQSGFEDGYRAGEAQALADFEARMTEASELIDDAHNYRRNVIAQSEPFLVELSIAIARRIVDHEISSNSDVILSIVKEALLKVDNMKKITIYVSPEQFNTVQKHREELQQLIDSAVELKVSPDKRVSLGSCIIRSEEGTVDAQIEVQLSQIKEQLLAIAQGSGSVGT